MHCSGQYWAYLRTFYRAPGHWQGVMPGYVTIGLLADGMLMLPQTAPSAHRQDHTGATGTFSHNFTLGCLWSSELWLIMSCNKLPRHRQCYVYQDSLHFQVIGPLPWSGSRWFNNFSSLTHALCQRLFRNPHCDYKHFRRSQAYIGISVKLQTRSTSCYFNSPF